MLICTARLTVTIHCQSRWRWVSISNDLFNSWWRWRILRWWWRVRPVLLCSILFTCVTLRLYITAWTDCTVLRARVMLYCLAATIMRTSLIQHFLSPIDWLPEYRPEEEEAVRAMVAGAIQGLSSHIQVHSFFILWCCIIFQFIYCLCVEMLHHRLSMCHDNCCSIHIHKDVMVVFISQ